MMHEDEIRRRMAPLQDMQAPAGFTSRVMAACAREPRAIPHHRRPAFLRAASLGLAAILALVLFATNIPSPTPPEAASREDLREARRELAWTLNLTTRVLDRSGSRALHTIFAEEIPDAINHSLQQTFESNRKGQS